MSRLLAYIKANNWQVKPLQLTVIRNTFGRIDHWDDTFVLLRSDGTEVFTTPGTADPGLHYSKHSMNPRGTARIANGQHLDCWQRGYHFKQRAFVQCKPIRVSRDADRDLFWSEEAIAAESGMGLNVHTTSSKPSLVGRWSAGCLVIQDSSVFYNKLNPEFDRSGLKYLSVNVVDSEAYKQWRAKWG